MGVFRHHGRCIEEGEQRIDFLAAGELLGDLDVVALGLGFGIPQRPSHDRPGAMHEAPAGQLALDGLDRARQGPSLSDADDAVPEDFPLCQFRDDLGDAGRVKSDHGQLPGSVHLLQAVCQLPDILRDRALSYHLHGIG